MVGPTREQESHTYHVNLDFKPEENELMCTCSDANKVIYILENIPILHQTHQPPKQEKRRFILEKYIAIHKKGGKMD